MTPMQRVTNAFRVDVRRPADWLKLAAAIVALGGSITGAVRWTLDHPTHAEIAHDYVPRDTFNLYRRDVATQHALDSVVSAANTRLILGLVASLDSSDRCRRNLKQYCR